MQSNETSLDQYFYKSPFVYDYDLAKVWCENWLWAGHVSDIPDPGDYFLFDFGAESIIVLRDEGGEIRAHVNVCRHRGSRVCLSQSGNAAVFSCPYHGWTYQLDGTLRGGRAMGERFDATMFGLFSVHVHEFQGLIFINMSDRPAPLDDALARIEPHIAPFNLARTKVVCSRRYRVAANWKLALENYLECYHCAPAHKEYARSHSLKNPSEMHPELIADMQARSIQAGLTTEVVRATGVDANPLGADILVRRYPLYEGYVTGSESGAPLAPLLGHLTSYDGGATDITIGPMNHFLAYSDHLVGYRFIPRDILTTDMEVVWMVHADARKGTDFDLDELTWLWDVTTQDDERIIRNNQEGVNSTRYQPGPLSTMEWGVQEFLKWYLMTLES